MNCAAELHCAAINQFLLLMTLVLCKNHLANRNNPDWIKYIHHSVSPYPPKKIPQNFINVAIRSVSPFDFK